MNTATATRLDDFPLWRVIPDTENEGQFVGGIEHRDGRRFLIRSSSREALEKHIIDTQMRNHDNGEDRFLAAWKMAVKVKPDLFHCDAPGIDDATDKEQLRPNWDAVEGFLRSKPDPWLRKFIMSTCSFYNDDWMKDWAKRMRYPRTPIGDLAIRLDVEHREILSDLLTSYRGW